MVRPKIYNRGKFYRLTEEGLEIDKERGTGRVLTTLLENPGKWYDLDKIREVSRWQNPKKEMRELSMEVNAWMSGSYRIEQIDEEGSRYYRIVRVKRKRSA